MRSSLRVARLVNLVLVGMLTGNEFGSFVAIYPALGRISPMARLEAEQGIYRRLGRIMPYYMGRTLASFLPVLAIGRRPGASAFRFTSPAWRATWRWAPSPGPGTSRST